MLYTFTFKQNNIEMEFTTTDKDMIDREFERWLISLYNVQSPCKHELLQDIVENKSEFSEFINEVNPVFNEVNETEQIQESEITVITDENQQTENEKIEQDSEQLPLPLVLNIMPDINEQEQYDEARKEVFAHGAKKMPSGAVTDFLEVLQERIKSTKAGAIQEKSDGNHKINSFLIDKNPQTQIDYLICAAYYLFEREKFDRFSLKQINYEVSKLGQKSVDHSVIQQAVSKKYIKVVPDFTGMADFTEYTITEEGEEYFISEL